MFQDVSRCFKMFQDVSRCFKIWVFSVPRVPRFGSIRLHGAIASTLKPELGLGLGLGLGAIASTLKPERAC